MHPSKIIFLFQSYRKLLNVKGLLVILPLCLVFFLAGCDPCNPMGVRDLGFKFTGRDSETLLIAVTGIWGPCGIGHPYKSIDGGYTWSEIHFNNFSKDFNLVTVDCTYSCEFDDPQTEQIRYRILTGKSLQRSFDDGITWREELHIPPWNQMEKNYVNAVFWDIGPTPVDVRGPFSAVTDPKTGNLIVAMGLEGILVRSKDNPWSWIDVADFEQIKPSPLEMIGLIHIQEWLRGPIILLLSILIGIHASTIIRLRFTSMLLMILSMGLILIPFDIIAYSLSIPFSMLRLQPLKDKLFHLSPSLLVISSLAVYIPVILKPTWQKNRAFVLRLAVLSMTLPIVYWSGFFAWSQGILLTKYEHATLVGLALFLTGNVIINVYIKKSWLKR